MQSPAPFLPSLLRRLIAGGGVALVLFLSVAAASPAVHAWLHGHGDHEAQACEHHHDHEVPAGAEDAGCAVTLFGTGVLTLVVWQFPRAGLTEYPEHRRTLSAARPAAEPRYRLVPSHAPPVV